MMESFDDLKEAYARLKALDVKIDAVVDPGLLLGIHFRDPDGNGLEVSYELPREQRSRESEADINALRALAPAPRPQAITPPAPHAAPPLERRHSAH